MLRHISEDECNMRLIRNLRAISWLSLILLLLVSAIVGALLSYMWVVGYYENLRIRTPQKSDVTIVNATFPAQDTSFFNVTIFNPSYSPSTASITQIETRTKDGLIHNITSTDPKLPYSLPKATQDFPGLQTFECRWEWANYTGEKVGIIAFLADGSGPTFEAETPFVDLGITDVRFNSTKSATRFNITVHNFVSSTTRNVTLDITGISVTVEDGNKTTITETDPLLPWPLNPGDSQNFTCTWDWTKHQNTSVTVAVYTSQGYMNYTTQKTPLPVSLEITSVLFDVNNTTRFDVTVKNDRISPTHLNVTKIAVMLGNLTVHEWTEENGTAVNPPIPFTLDKNSTETLACPWNWTTYRDLNVTLMVNTQQGFTTNYSQITPPPVIIDITDTIFDPIDTEQFNITVQNSKSSLFDTEITEISVTIQNETVTKLSDRLDLPIPLKRTQSVNLTCPWDWGAYVGENATIVVETEQGYPAYSDPITLTALTISDATFNPVRMDYFIITIQNPTLLNLTLATVDVTIDEDSFDITSNVVPPFPFQLPAGANYTFVCSWGWAPHQGQPATLKVYTSEGYWASAKPAIPSIS